MVGASFGGSRTGVTLVLAGVAVSALASAVQTFLLQRNVAVVREVYSWILGRLSTAQWSDVRLVLPYVVVAAAVLLAHRRQLDVFRIGEDEASTLGAPVARVRLVVVIAATLGTAAVVSVSGLIGFVGIMVPHVVRLVAGSSYRRVLPLSFIFGAAFLILADIPGRLLLDPAETPIGVVTAFLGAPFLIIVLRARSQGSVAMSSLELRELAVHYGRHQALAPFSDVVHSGEWLGLIGPNGAGKSSLLRAVVGARRGDGRRPRRRLVPVVAEPPTPGRPRRLRAAVADDPRRHDAGSSTCSSAGRRTSATSGPRAATTRR